MIYHFLPTTEMTLLSTYEVVLCIVLVKCDFEDGLCGMEQGHWRIGSGLTRTKNTGPDYDHTTLGPEGWFE